MAKSKKQKELDKELLRECRGYTTTDNKPDGAYIEVNRYFFNLNKIKRLIASGADVNAKTGYGNTPLHWAVERDNIAIAKLLIDSGADVRAENQYGTTPLHWAVWGDNIELAKLLIEAGADVGAKNNDDTTPLHRAKSEEMRALLKQHGAK